MRRRDHVQHVLDQWRREAAELDRSPFGVIGRISRLAQLLQAELEPIFAAHGLNAGEFDVLAALRRAGRPYRLSPTELSTALIITSGGMTKRLNALEARGLIRREPDPSDGRSTAVALTRDGKRLVDAILPEQVANERRLLGELNANQRANSRVCLRRWPSHSATMGAQARAPGERPPTAAPVAPTDHPHADSSTESEGDSARLVRTQTVVAPSVPSTDNTQAHDLVQIVRRHTSSAWKFPFCRHFATDVWAMGLGHEAWCCV
jgi:DNA-binding MarR family transcriptional regulator